MHLLVAARKGPPWQLSAWGEMGPGLGAAAPPCVATRRGLPWERRAGRVFSDGKDARRRFLSPDFPSSNCKVHEKPRTHGTTQV